MGAILFLFLTHLGIGIALTLLLISHTAGVKFFRFNAGLAVILLVIALALRPDDVALSAGAQGVALWALIVATLALLIYWVTIGRMLAALRPLLLWTAVGCGLLSLVAQAIATTSNVPTGLTIASFLTSAALLGGTCTAMILGHWYLVLPSMEISLLQSIVKFHIRSTILRITVVGAVVFLAIASWEPSMGPSFERYIFSLDGVFFWQRVLFGLCGPVLLAYMTWETAKIRSTQSATGILYVDFFAVIVGEVLAKYLLLTTSVPV